MFWDFTYSTMFLMSISSFFPGQMGSCAQIWSRDIVQKSDLKYGRLFRRELFRTEQKGGAFAWITGRCEPGKAEIRWTCDDAFTNSSGTGPKIIPRGWKNPEIHNSFPKNCCKDIVIISSVEMEAVGEILHRSINIQRWIIFGPIKFGWKSQSNDIRLRSRRV